MEKKLRTVPVPEEDAQQDCHTASLRKVQVGKMPYMSVRLIRDHSQVC